MSRVTGFKDQKPVGQIYIDIYFYLTLFKTAIL